MLFNSLEYFVFLAFILVLYYSLNQRFQNYMLLVASYIFYGFWDYRFLSLIMISTVVDYMVGRQLGKIIDDPAKRKILLAISISVNLGILGFFKYYNFFAENADRILSVIGFHSSLPVLYIILPVGISFYTFQTMAYSVEVYRQKMEPVENLADFALYVCYFPQLVAGPIERPQHLIPELQSRRIVDTEKFISGFTLILIGLFRKVVIADALGVQIDPIFSNPNKFSSPELIKGIYLFALQIYCDFAGYSDIARGTSRLLGIELMRNFNQPYFSANIAEFWRRWHISLSTWLRDYLYIPLGGNRHGTLNTYRNLMVTMLLGGLWHGAAWSFVIWGGLHGTYLVVQRMINGNKKVPEAPENLWNWKRLSGIFVTFHLVLLTWVFFRAPGLQSALDYLTQLFSFRDMESLTVVLPAIIIPYLLSAFVDIPQFLTGNHTFIKEWPKPIRNVAVAIMLFLILLGVGSRAPFIYFQF